MKATRQYVYFGNDRPAQTSDRVFTEITVENKQENRAKLLCSGKVLKKIQRHAIFKVYLKRLQRFIFRGLQFEG